MEERTTVVEFSTGDVILDTNIMLGGISKGNIFTIANNGRIIEYLVAEVENRVDLDYQEYVLILHVIEI